jgi:hypothetical protein
MDTTEAIRKASSIEWIEGTITAAHLMFSAGGPAEQQGQQFWSTKPAKAHWSAVMRLPSATNEVGSDEADCWLIE